MRLDYNTEDMPKNESGELIPDGWYEVEIEGIKDIVTYKGGTGPEFDDGHPLTVTVECRYKILGPTHAGRKLWHKLRLKHGNPECQRISHENLGSIMRACGLRGLENSEDLVGLTMLVKVGTSKAQEGYEPRNEPKGWKALQGGVLPPAAPRAAAAPAVPSVPKPAAPAAGGAGSTRKPPFLRKPKAEAAEVAPEGQDAPPPSDEDIPF